MRFTRTRLVFLGAIIVSLLLAACGGGEDATAPPRATAAPQATTAPQPGATTPAQATARPTAAPTATPVPPPTATPSPTSSGELTVAISSFQNFELVSVGGISKLYLDSIYDYIIGTNNDGKLDGKTGLASSWELSADGTTFTVKVRDNVPFHDGTIASAADIEFMFEETTSDRWDYSAKGNFTNDLVSHQAVDRTTFTYTLKKRNIFWHVEFMSRAGRGGTPNHVLPATYIREAGREGINRKPVGTGTYKFKSAQVNDRLVLEAVDYEHFIYGLPRTKTLSYRAVPEATTQIALARAGDVDIIPVSRAGVSSAKAGGLQIFTRNNAGTGAIRVEGQFVKEYNGKPNPLNNRMVRQALFWYGIDRKAIVETFMQGLAAQVTMNYPLTAVDLAYLTDIPVPEYDPAKAKAMLAEAGYANGFDLRVFTWDPPRPGLPEGPEIMEAISVWWEGIGINIERQPIDNSPWRTQLFAQEYGAPKDGGNGAWDRPTVTGMWFLSTRSTAGSGAGGSHDIAGSAFGTNFDPEMHRLGQAWAGSANLEEYVANGQIYAKAQNECVGCTGGGVPVLTGGTLFATTKAVDLKWSLGNAGYGFNFEQAAALRF